MAKRRSPLLPPSPMSSCSTSSIQRVEPDRGPWPRPIITRRAIPPGVSMSFVHHLSIGHFRFARHADAPDWMTVVHPLDVALVTELLARFADDARVDSPTFASRPMQWEQGYITGPWWQLSTLNTAFVSFALALGERTDCQFADLAHRLQLDPTALRRTLDDYRRGTAGS